MVKVKNLQKQIHNLKTPPNKSPDPDGFIGESYIIFKQKLTPIPQKFFKKEKVYRLSIEIWLGWKMSYHPKWSPLLW